MAIADIHNADTAAQPIDIDRCAAVGGAIVAQLTNVVGAPAFERTGA